MIRLNKSQYSFSAASKTVSLTLPVSILLAEIKHIINVSTNEIIFRSDLVGKSGTILNNVLTLDFDTTSMANTDDLDILVSNVQLEGLDNVINTEITPSINSQIIINSNSNRRIAYIFNNTNKETSISYGIDAIKEKGFVLKKNKSHKVESFNGTVYGISDRNAKGKINIIEIIE